MTPRIPLHQQIESVAILKSVVTGSRVKPKQSQLDMLLERLDAAEASLRWLQDNEVRIRRAVGNGGSDL